LDEVDLAQLKTIAAEIASISSGEKANQAAVSSAKTEADVASTRPTALDEVDLTQLRTIAQEIVSTTSGDKAEQAAASGGKTEADDASTQPTAFDRIDLVQLGKTEPTIDSTSGGKDVAQAAVPSVGPVSDDIIVRVFPQDKPSSAGQHKTDFPIFADTVAGAPSRETAASANSTDVLQATLEALAAKAERMPEAKHSLSSEVESERTSKGRFDFSRGIKPDLKIEIQPESKLRIELIPKAEPGVTAGIRRETAALGRSTDILQATLEALAAEAERMPEAKHSLSSEVESERTSKGRFDFSRGIKPDLKIMPEFGSGVESTPEVEPGVAAEGALRNILAEKDAVFETDHQSFWKAATKPSRWPKQQWEMHRSKIYLGTSVLIFLLVLTLPQRSPETMFKELWLSLGLAAAPSMPVLDSHPDVGVWVDLHTGLYYCSGTEAYGKTGGGKFTTQRQAREEHFKPAASNVCQ